MIKMINNSCNHIELAFHMCTCTSQVHMFIISNEFFKKFKNYLTGDKLQGKTL